MRNKPMSSKHSLIATLVLSVAVVGATSLATVVAADKKDENKVSKDLAKPLKAAQDALQSKPPKLQEAVAKLKEAEANPKKTPYDEHIINALAGASE
jgi:outer membrane murein-binding lipoprotein Lpp